MFIKYLPFLLLLVSSRILANEYPVEIFEYLDDTKVVAFLKDSDIDKTAQWIPLETEVPLNINGALKAVSDLVLKDSDIDKTAQWIPLETEVPLNINGALKAVSDLADTDDSLEIIALTSIELKQIPGHPKHWHYLIKMKTESNGEIQPHYFVVLLDGKVIPAVKEPETFK